jgi:hypothetical protein
MNLSTQARELNLSKLKQIQQYSGNPCLFLILKKSEVDREAKQISDTFLTTVLPCQYHVSHKKKSGNKLTYDVVLKCSNNFSFVYGVDLSEWHNGMHHLITITVMPFIPSTCQRILKAVAHKPVSTTLPVWINSQKLKSFHLRTEITANYHDPSGRPYTSK